MTNHKQRGQGGLIPVADLLPQILSAGLFDEVVKPEDVGYTHPIFLQCFLPTRHTAKNRQRWQTTCGRASLVIRAGELANPAIPTEYETCIVPAGPKARFVVGYANARAACSERIMPAKLRHNRHAVSLSDRVR
jgi:hypothetical protein